MKSSAPSSKVTLDRFFSKRGLGSRKTATEWIRAGEVTVNGRVCRDPECWIDPDLDRIERKDAAVVSTEFSAILLYKKRGTVTTARDEKGRPTIFDGLPKDFPHLHAVGRLDQATSGLIFLTNSNLLSSYLTNPKNGISRVYLATVDGEWKDEFSAAIEAGISIQGEDFRVEKCVLRKKSKKESHLVLTLAEGKNREIRRLTAHFKCETRSLKRVQYGPFTLEKLQPGEWRTIEETEIIDAFPGYLQSTRL